MTILLKLSINVPWGRGCINGRKFSTIFSMFFFSNMDSIHMRVQTKWTCSQECSQTQVLYISVFTILYSEKSWVLKKVWTLVSE
jgi:hypothetical protein